MTAEFKHVMLMVKDVPAAVKFYSEGLGLPVKVASPGWGEVDANGTTIAFHAAESDANVGSSPILSFHVDDVYAALATLESMGAKLEGRVREPSFGKVAAPRRGNNSRIRLPTSPSRNEKS
ncbi:MAG: VOC family protein [Stigonema ocellatum SAG 48.90 = DSM 106950]|nr:VOC family protein [Stigonema ocellatum SAG 48.90 = DSM 106950]